jgi:hypothetical protein
MFNTCKKLNKMLDALEDVVDSKQFDDLPWSTQRKINRKKEKIKQKIKIKCR